VQKGPVVLDPSEHDSYLGADYETAIGLLYWQSSKKAFEAVENILQGIPAGAN
jgi:hypothetical protein